MNKQALLIIVFIGLAALICWQYFLPTFNEVSVWRGELKVWQEKLSETQELKAKFEELKIKYDNLVKETDRVAQAVPQEKDVPSLLVLFEDMSSRNGLVMDGVDFNVVDDKKDKKLSSPGMKTLIAKLSLSGSYEALKSFLETAEASLRIMDVWAIDFGEQDVGVTSRDFEISLNTYFRE